MLPFKIAQSFLGISVDLRLQGIQIREFHLRSEKTVKFQGDFLAVQIAVKIQDPRLHGNAASGNRGPGADVGHRIYSLLEDVKREHGDKNVLIVCHGGVMRLIRSYFEDMTNDEYYHYSEPNASVREFEL